MKNIQQNINFQMFHRIALYVTRIHCVFVKKLLNLKKLIFIQIYSTRTDIDNSSLQFDTT